MYHYPQRRARFILFTLLFLLPVWCNSQVLIQNARIIDGTGGPDYLGSVHLDDERIAAIGDLKPRPDDNIVQANGLVLAPGFIDTHSHHDTGILNNREALAAVSQGITTIVRGQDGESGTWATTTCRWRISTK